MKKQQIEYIATPKIRKYEPKPDGIEIFGTGSTAPRDFIKKPIYLSRKDYIRYFLHADRFSFWAAVIAVLMILALVGVQIWKANTKGIGAETSISESVIVPSTEQTVAPTVTPEITPTTVIIQLAPIVDRRIFKITAYCSCAICCKKTDGIGYGGAHVQEGVTCAADLSVLPLGSVVDIEGIGLRTVQDKGSKVKGDHLDLFYQDHNFCVKFGVQYRMVTIFAKEAG